MNISYICRLSQAANKIKEKETPGSDSEMDEEAKQQEQLIQRRRGGSDAVPESSRKKIPHRHMSIASYENIDDLITLNSSTALVSIDQPVHVFPLEIFPPVVVDPETNTKINMTENMIQPQLYMNQDNSLCVCDFGCCDCQDSCSLCLGGSVAAVVGLGNLLFACGNTQVSSASVCSCDALFPESCCFNASLCGEGGGSDECCAPSAPAGPSLCDTIGFESVCGNFAGDISNSITGAATGCYNGASQCSAAMTSCITDCYVSCLSSIRAPFQVMYNELYMCYRQLTSCC